ncbi:cytochrome P450 [Aspergillus karnatakaensis]|uniref:cytochrome P450 n=1 Tax=Aspergillus karnatakaensis TaxID=1810916 RepID=UPI003CCDC011
MASYPVSLATAVLGVLALPVLRIIYNLYFHPLSKVPGPPSWAATRFPYSLALIRGTILQQFQDLHVRYGPLIRVAPNEVTVAHPDAYVEVFQPSKTRPYFPKNPIWWAPPGIPDSITATNDREKHARIRRLLAPSLTTRAIRDLEGSVQKYINLLVDRLSELAKSQEDNIAEVDMGPWFNYTTFDVFADVGFGESFDCLQHSKYHPWIELTLTSVKYGAYVFPTRFHPLIESILQKLIPPSVNQMRADYLQQVADRVRRRLNFEFQRPDVMSSFIGKDGTTLLPMEEVTSNFLTLVVAGSETTATALTGTLLYLLDNQEILHRLNTEIRDSFESFSDITFDAVQKLSYLNAVLQEGLRLCPPVPWSGGRIVPEGGETVCGTWIPGGTYISVQAYTIHRDPTLFHKSTTLIPDRWLPDASSNPDSPFFNDHRDSVQPFLVGPHACIGINLAWAELRTILAKLVWSFDFAAGQGENVPWEERKTYFLYERKPVHVRIKVREGVM